MGNVHSLIRDLQRRKARERRGLVVAEGRRLVADALAGGAAVRAVIVAADVSDGSAAGVLADAVRRGIATEVTSRKEFEALADTETPSGVLAVVEWEPLTLDALRPGTGPVALLVLDAIQDPGNVGTMIRTAFALGAAATIALDGTADPRSQKVLRSAMGAIFRHPVAEAHAAECVEFLARHRIELWAATMDGAAVGAAVPERVALAVGNEGGGIRPELLERAARRVAVPMAEGAESLNAAVAAGILLHRIRDAH
ncbi:MAG: RNA methyltransferase [Gemmatimonadota bacterium]